MPDRSHRPRPMLSLLNLLWRQPLWAIPFALFFGTLYGSGVRSYWIAYQISLVFAYCIGLAVWGVASFLLPWLLRRRGSGGLSFAVQIGTCYLGASLVGAYAAAFIAHFTIHPGFMGSLRLVLISGMFTLLFAALFGGINYAIVFYRQAVERASAVELARAELARAELRALRAQVNPHFLFNTLNTIAALISENPRAAEETTTRLAEAFRYTLKTSEAEHAPLGEELAFLRNYLEIERMRFGDQLRFEESIEPGLENARVPGLLLQPIVENAVRYGLRDRAQSNLVRLSARRGDRVVVVEVSDNGPGMEPGEPPSGAGFGLHSVRERLRAAGPPHDLEIHSTPGSGTRVRVTLPLIFAPGTEHTIPKGASS